VSSHRTLIPLLEADAELAEGLAGAELDGATRALAVHAVTLEAGPWDPHDERWPVQPTIGLLVLEGVVTRDIIFAGRTTTELLGAGDVLRPWEDDVQFDPLPFGVGWHVHEPTRVAVLDGRVALASARWPVIAGALSRRHVRRARSLAFQLAIAQLPRVDDRLLGVWARRLIETGFLAAPGGSAPRPEGAAGKDGGGDDDEEEDADEAPHVRAAR